MTDERSDGGEEEYRVVSCPNTSRQANFNLQRLHAFKRHGEEQPNRSFPCRAETEIKCLGTAIVLFVFSTLLSEDTLKDEGFDRVLKQHGVKFKLTHYTNMV